MRRTQWIALRTILFLPAAVGHAAADTDEKVVVLETSQGNIVIELFYEDAPNHVDNFIELANSGFYDGTVFHRVISNFLI